MKGGKNVSAALRALSASQVKQLRAVFTASSLRVLVV